MDNSANTIDKLINDVVKLVEETDNNRIYQQLGSLVDSLISYVDNTIYDHPLTQDSIDKLNKLELQYGSKKFESVKESLVINKFIYKQGKLLANTLAVSSNKDEVELISDQIGTYTMLVSIYGKATGKVPESLGVDLSEAALFKLDELQNKTGKNSESDKYIKHFTDLLDSLYR